MKEKFILMLIFAFQMDSLTQIVLGAAVGEAAGGKKLSNKAMFWGAVGGTIPDLDVFFGHWLEQIGIFDSMDELAFHRGISHSIFFAVIASFILGWIVHKHYKNPKRHFVSVLRKFYYLWCYRLCHQLCTFSNLGFKRRKNCFLEYSSWEYNLRVSLVSKIF